MSRLAIVQHDPAQGPGLFAEVLAEENIDFDLVEMHAGASFPAAGDCEAVIGLGGGDAKVYSDELEDEMKRMRATVEAGVPQLHICYAAQLLVRAAKGEIIRAPRPEVGFLDPESRPYVVQPTKEGRADPIFDGIKGGFSGFQLHGDRMRITGWAEDISLLATGNELDAQVVRVEERAYGLQFHPEVTPDLLDGWCDAYPDFLDDKPQLWTEFEAGRAASEERGARILRNFLALAGLRHSDPKLPAPRP
jgi:GMP synthase (glutamine-hydrolysing)